LSIVFDAEGGAILYVLRPTTGGTM
jgi:hypothetical protein